MPAWLMCRSSQDLLRLLRHPVEGMSTPQVYIKVPGVWTGGHEENLRYLYPMCKECRMSCLIVRMYVRIWMDGWMDGWRDEWMDGRTEKGSTILSQTYLVFINSLFTSDQQLGSLSSCSHVPPHSLKTNQNRLFIPIHFAQVSLCELHCWSW